MVGHNIKSGKMRFLGPNLNSKITAISSTNRKGSQIIGYAEKQNEQKPVAIITRMIKGKPKILLHDHLPSNKDFKISQIAFSTAAVFLSAILKSKVLYDIIRMRGM